MKRVLSVLVAALIATFVFFHFGVLGGNLLQSVTAILIVFVIAFLSPPRWPPTPSPSWARTPCRA